MYRRFFLSVSYASTDAGSCRVNSCQDSWLQYGNAHRVLVIHVFLVEYVY